MEITNATKGWPSATAAVIGMFDGVHTGHRFLLDTLKEQAAIRELTPTVFTFPRHPLSVINPGKAPALLTTPAEKLAKLKTTGFGTGQIAFMVFDPGMKSMTAAQFMQMLNTRYGVRYILRGFNNRFGTERDLTNEDYRRIAADNGIELAEAGSFCHRDNAGCPPVSSSLIRQSLLQGDIEEANAMLGVPYHLAGKVVGGKRLGRTLGFPTANLLPSDPDKLIPAGGVYFCKATPEGNAPHRAIVNIGTRPTVDGDNHQPTIEAHILDFDGDIYGRRVDLQFLSRLRSEQKFDNISQLVSQLEIDRLTAMSLPLP